MSYLLHSLYTYWCYCWNTCTIHACACFPAPIVRHMYQEVCNIHNELCICTGIQINKNFWSETNYISYMHIFEYLECSRFLCTMYVWNSFMLRRYKKNHFYMMLVHVHKKTKPRTVSVTIITWKATVYQTYPAQVCRGSNRINTVGS